MQRQAWLVRLLLHPQKPRSTIPALLIITSRTVASLVLWIPVLLSSLVWVPVLGLVVARSASVLSISGDHHTVLWEHLLVTGGCLHIFGFRSSRPGRFFPVNLSGTVADGPARVVVRFATGPSSEARNFVIPELVSSGSLLVMMAGGFSMGGRVSRRADLRIIAFVWWTMPGAIPATESGQGKRLTQGTRQMG